MDVDETTIMTGRAFNVCERAVVGEVGETSIS